MIIAYNKKDDQIFGGYTPMPWTFINLEDDKQKIFTRDDSGTTFLFLLRSEFAEYDEKKYPPRIFKLKKYKYDKAICTRYDSIFGSGCCEFSLKENNQLDTDGRDCCFEW